MKSTEAQGKSNKTRRSLKKSNETHWNPMRPNETQWSRIESNETPMLLQIATRRVTPISSEKCDWDHPICVMNLIVWKRIAFQWKVFMNHRNEHFGSNLFESNLFESNSLNHILDHMKWFILNQFFNKKLFWNIVWQDEWRICPETATSKNKGKFVCKSLVSRLWAAWESLESRL